MMSLQLFIPCLAGFHLIVKSRCIDSEHSFTEDGYVCVSSYWDTVSCVLNITHNNDGETGFALRFSQESRYQSCPLVPVNGNFHTVCRLELDEPTFISLDVYDIDLCYNSICTSVVKRFKPSWNLQLTAPGEVRVHHTPDNITLMWKSGYEGHKYLSDALRYEIQIQQRSPSQTTTWVRTTRVETSHLSALQLACAIPTQPIMPNSEAAKRQMLSLELPDPETDEECCVKVRSSTREGLWDYKATWSLWSSEVCAEIKGRQGQENLFKYLGFISACAGLGLIIFSCAERKRLPRFSFSRTPSPAPYFQSLFQQHGGNLLEWLSPHGNVVVASTNEEIVAISRVSVESKPSTGDLLLQLPLTQTHNGDVSLPQTREVSSQTFSCQLNPFYTQAPCGPDEFRDDEGIECQEEIPESSLADEKRSRCRLTDYCTLTRTGEVMIPVLMPSSPHSFRSNLDQEV